MSVSKETIKEVFKSKDLSDDDVETVSGFINGLLNRAKGDGLEESFALESAPADRPCGRESGPCCGGKCG